MFGLNWNGFREKWCGEINPPFTESDYIRAGLAITKYAPSLVLARYSSLPIKIFVVIDLVDIGLLLDQCQGFQRFDQVLERLIKGDVAALSELRIARTLDRFGYQVELEPPMNGKVLDCLGEHESGRIYCEVVTPRQSKAIAELEATMNALMEELFEHYPGWRVEVNLIVSLTGSVLEEVRTNLHNGQEVFEQTESVHIKKTRPEQGAPFDEGAIKGVINGPVVTVSQFSVKDGLASGVIIRANTSDIRDGFVKKKSKKFSHGSINILAIDCSNIFGSFKEWQTSMCNALTSDRYTRISALLFYSYAGYLHGVQEDVALVYNKYAAKPLPDSATKLFENFLQGKQ